MDINDLFDGIMKSIKQFAFDPVEQRLQEKMQETGRGPENEGKNAENLEPKETNLPGRQKFGQPQAGRAATGHRDVACNRGVTNSPIRK